MAALNDDLNVVITNAVQARIEASVLEALSSDETFARFVTAALQEPISKDYGRTKTTYMAEVVGEAIKVAAKQSVAKVMAEMQPQIEEEVAKCLRRDLEGIAAALVGSVTRAVDNPYGVTIMLNERSS
jgi:hypothetical protein